MKTIFAAAHLLQGQTPARLNDGGIKNPGATAYYLDVPVTAMPAQCKLTPTEYGFLVEGAIEDCAYSGQAFSGAQEGRFRRVMLSFVKRSQPVPLH